MSANGAAAGGSLSDRISKPEVNTTSGRSWADEVNSPDETDPPAETNLDSKVAEDVPKEDAPKTATDQTDGAGEPFGGSGLHEPEYNVQVKLADMQADPNNPLFSATTFEQLGL